MAGSLPSEFIISEAQHGQRIDQALAQCFPDYSRTRWGEWIKQGKILINQSVSRAKDKVRQNDRITLNVHPETEQRTDEQAKAQPLALDILYEDSDLLVLNKPAGLVVHPGAGNPENTLLNALLYHHDQARQLIRGGIVHRLDKDTSGLMIVAKSAAAQTRLIQQLQNRDVKREYLALACGHLISGATIETFYGRHPKNRLKMAVTRHGKTALTSYKIEKQYEDYTLLGVNLGTGRTHQIRVHLAHIKHPLVGDPVYGKRLIIPRGADEALADVLRAFKRQALHAVALHFQHPVTERPMAFEAPLPDDFLRLLAALDTFYEMD